MSGTVPRLLAGAPPAGTPAVTYPSRVIPPPRQRDEEPVPPPPRLPTPTPPRCTVREVAAPPKAHNASPRGAARVAEELRLAKIRTARASYTGARAAWKAAVAAGDASGELGDWARAVALAGTLDEATTRYLRALGEVT